MNDEEFVAEGWQRLLKIMEAPPRSWIIPVQVNWPPVAAMIVAERRYPQLLEFS